MNMHNQVLRVQRGGRSFAYSVVFVLMVTTLAPVSALALTDADWDTVNDLLRNQRNAAGSDTALNTQCSAAGVCLEVSKWLYVMGQQQAYREDLITKADEILNISNFQNKPWAVYYSDIGISILATEDMAYLFRHSDLSTVYLDSIYYYDESLGGSDLDHTERQRLFVEPAVEDPFWHVIFRSLWKVECREYDDTDPRTLYSQDATGMSVPTIGGTNGVNATLTFTWNDLAIYGTDRHIKVEVKVEVYTGTQSITGMSQTDSRHGSWWIDVTHVSGNDHSLWNVEYPRLEGIKKFHRFTDESYLLIPYCGGTTYPVGAVLDNELEYPGNVIPYQLAVNYQRNAGLLYYCDDTSGFRKRMKPVNSNDTTSITWVHYPKRQGDLNARLKLTDGSDLGYACRIGVFQGDWYDAALWYRENWLDDTFADFLPDSIRGGWLLDAHHGLYTWGYLQYQYDSWLDAALDAHFPGSDWTGSLSAYEWRPNFRPEETPYKGQYVYVPMVEEVSQAGRDYVYDPIHGQHYNRLKRLRTEHGIRSLLYMGSLLMDKLFYNFGEYPDSPYYTYNGVVMASKRPDGVSEHAVTGTNQWRGIMCPASIEWQDFVSGQIEQTVIRAGTTTTKYPGGIYFDVSCVGPSYGGPCYSEVAGHDHPDQRGGGNYYAQGTIQLLDKAKLAGQNGGNNPDFVVVSEGNADIFLKHIDSYIKFQNNDDTQMSLPVQEILWADFIRPYADKYGSWQWDGGNKRTRVKTARAFVWGQGMGRITSETTGTNDNHLRALKRMVWYRRNFSQFLARGRMYRPPQTNCALNEVLCATWKSGENILFAFANGTDSDKSVIATVDIRQCGVTNPLAYRLYEVDSDGTFEDDANATDFPSSGILDESFVLKALGDPNDNKGILCFVAEKQCGPTDPDLVPSGTIDLADFAFLASQWFNTDCGYPNNCCEGADLHSDGVIDVKDLAECVEFWLQ